MKGYNLEGQAAGKAGKIGKELQESFQRTRSTSKWDVLIQTMRGCSLGPTTQPEEGAGICPGEHTWHGGQEWGELTGFSHCWPHVIPGVTGWHTAGEQQNTRHKRQALMEVLRARASWAWLEAR